MHAYELLRNFKFTDEEKEAVIDYTGNMYRQINRYLRSGEAIDAPKMESYVKNIDKVMQANPIQKNLTTFRHIDVNEKVTQALFGVKDISKVKAGTRFGETGFSSTSFSSTKTKWFGDVTLVYKLKAGGKARGFAIDDKSVHHGEREFIVSRGATGKVRRVSNKSGRLVIEIDID